MEMTITKCDHDTHSNPPGWSFDNSDGHWDGGNNLALLVDYENVPI